MYTSWSPANGQGSSPYVYIPDDQRNAEYRRDAYAYIPQSQPSNPYAFNATQTMPIQQTQVAGNQTYFDPHLTVKQTNQTLSALASARRLAPEYMLTHDTPPSNPAHTYAHQGSYYEQQGQYYENYGGSPEPSYGLRSAQTPSVPVPRPAMTHVNPKTAEGHACEYCGKAFGRPSALKIHLAIHTGERAYMCPEAGCHRKFSVRSNMSRHIRNVHQIWPEGGDIDSGDSGDDKNST